MSSPSFALGDRVRITHTKPGTRCNAYKGEEYVIIAGPHTSHYFDEETSWTEYVGVWVRHYDKLRSDATTRATLSVQVEFIDADTAVLVPREVVA